MSDTINCPQCSSPLPAGASFCTSCGHRLEAAPTASDQFTPPEDATRVETPGLNDPTQTFAPPSEPPAGGPSGGFGAAPAPWQPADSGAPATGGWNPAPPQAQQPAPQQAWQQPQPGAAPQGWGAAPGQQGGPAPWETHGAAPASAPSGAAQPSQLGGIAGLVGGVLTLVGLFTAWFKVTGADAISGWDLASGDKGLESKDPYIVLALGLVAIAVGVMLFVGQKRPIARIVALVVGVAIVGVAANDWMTTASLVEDELPSSVELTGQFGFYLTIVGGIVTAAAALLPAKK